MCSECLLLCGEQKLKQAIEGLGMPPYRVKQIREWLFKRFVFSFDEMTNLSVSDREKLKKAFPKILLSPERVFQDKQDKTLKLLIRLADNGLIEAVALPDEKTITFCISSQVGCKLACAFCRTGSNGFKRSLTAEEIIMQVMMLIKKTGKKPTNIVFMGMGEPFDNRRAVFEAIDTLTSPQGLNLADRRITISTSGIVDGIEALSMREGEVNLAVSLHSADNTVRSAIMPINKRFPLERLKEAIKAYCLKTGRRVTLEVVLLDKINDGLNDAMNLISFCEGLIVHVNIVRFNHFKGSHYRASSEENEKAFRKTLKKAKIAVTVRRPRGRSILAACGQLAGKNNG